jgi:hypothetical protein
MRYEELSLRPVTGAIDHQAITAWLAAQEHAFLHQWEFPIWHLCWDAEDVADAQELFRRELPRFGYGSMVILFPDYVSVQAMFAGRCEVRALEFIRWLVRDREWLVKLDWSERFDPLGDPARLFPVDIEVPRHTVVDDVTEGVRHEWTAGDQRLVVHSSGQFRASVDNRRGWHGYLTEAALKEWQATVVALPTSESSVVVYSDSEDPTGRYGIVTPEDFETAYFDVEQTPELLRPIAALVDRWLDELSRWDHASPSPIVRRLRDDD